MDSMKVLRARGFTIPVVPRIDMPPTMPSLGLKVLLVTLLPSGTLMVISAEVLGGRASLTDSIIILLGTGFIAGSPTVTCNPGLVTMPTPSPPLTTIPVPWRRLTVAHISMPWVTSYFASSPAFFTTLALAVLVDMTSHFLIGISISFPEGLLILTALTGPIESVSVAAFAAAAAQAPVVKPVCNYHNRPSKVSRVSEPL